MIAIVVAVNCQQAICHRFCGNYFPDGCRWSIFSQEMTLIALKMCLLQE